MPFGETVAPTEVSATGTDRIVGPASHERVRAGARWLWSIIMEAYQWPIIMEAYQ